MGTDITSFPIQTKKVSELDIKTSIDGSEVISNFDTLGSKGLPISLLKSNILEYNAAITYNTDDLVQEDSTTKLYKSLTDTNLGNVLTDVINWQLLGDLADLVNTQQATEVIQGTAEIATDAEVITGTDDDKIITPLKLENRIGTAALLDSGAINGNVPVIGAGDKLATALIDTGNTDGEVPLVSTGDKLPNAIINDSSETVSGIGRLATTLETNTGTNDLTNITPKKLNESINIQDFASLSSETGLSTIVTAGNSLNLLTLLTQANESLRKESFFNLKDTGGSTISKLLDESNDKFVFPSNINSFNRNYKGYIIRVNFTADFAGAIGATEEYDFRLRRVIDNTIIDTRIVARVELESALAQNRGILFHTFVEGESDPFVVDGVFIDVFVPTAGLDVTFTALSVLIQSV